MGVDDEDDADDLAVPAGDLEAIGAPAQVRAHHHHLAVVQAALAAAGVALQQQAVPLHDPEDALVVGCRLALCGQRPVHQRGDAAIAIGRPLVDQPADQRQQRLVAALQ